MQYMLNISINNVLLLFYTATFILNFVPNAESSAKIYSIKEEQIHAKCLTSINNDNSIIRLHNWGGNVNFSTLNVQYPRSVEQVQHIVRNAKKLRVLGSRHSFSQIADCPDTLLSMLGLNRVIKINNNSSSMPSVIVQAGITYDELAPVIHSAGFALENLAATDKITVGGAISTSAHGSGMHLGNLATQVRALQLILANGTLAWFGPNSSELKALAVGLGAFGVITQVELNLIPVYTLASYEFENLSTEFSFAHFEKILSLGHTVSLGMDLKNANSWDIVDITIKSNHDVHNIAKMMHLYGATQAASTSVDASSSSSSSSSSYDGANKAWYKQLATMEVGRDGDDLQTEYFVPFPKAVDAIKAVIAMGHSLREAMYFLYIRTTKSDDLWMSLHYSSEHNGSFVALHFNWDPAKHAMIERRLLPALDKTLTPFDARPHWGKFFISREKQFLATYPKLGEFKQLANKLDPTGKFRNKFLEENVFTNL